MLTRPRGPRNRIHSEFRRSFRRALLEAELGTYQPLVGYLNDAVRLVEARTGRAIEEELLGRLLDRLGVTDADLALERVAADQPHV
jgi:hypothetical protein